MAAKGNITVLRDDFGGEQTFTVDSGQSLNLCHIAGGQPSCLTVEIGENASAKILFTAISGAASDLRYQVEFCGRGGRAEIYGLFLAGEGERREVATVVRHNVPDCTSDQIVKGVASANGEGRFDGLVYVAPDAQHTEALQQSRNLLLSDKARIETLPQLEIYADDVRCSHGATVGQMNDEAIYYMRQRGIDEQEARRLQMSGFAHDILTHCADETLVAELIELIDNKIDTL